ncbi:CBS domain-containing protein [Myxococcus qinghaiensis]|uniref:CBS domain-containing protein n=1 Tax=Myxococcus qinghaiensis TaxID=2906758 RepID=UPI0020A753FF|nr:CBS domain-containing protein [Myxococcus qinghaiensis]MCP3169015.1 CBS domain-containing protein [Myxococcus qinghaiensis]
MCRSPEFEMLVAHAVTLFPEDTVLSALQVMHRHGVHALPVVDGQNGAWLGEVSQHELQRLSAFAPLARLAEILTAKALASTEEKTAVATPTSALLLHAPSQRWLH